MLGKRFGKLIVIKPSKTRRHHEVHWLCRCDCGALKEISTHTLNRGQKSCGCLQGKQPLNLAGKRFGKLVALHPTDGRQANWILWECLCDCGNKCLAATAPLKQGHKLSCGCLHLEVNKNRAKHGLWLSKEYRMWIGMKSRCLNPKSRAYKWYGKLGVQIYPEWEDDFSNFLQYLKEHDMYPRPVGKSIDRIDPFGNYEPGNIRWATQKEQMHNLRRQYQPRLVS